MSYGEIQRHKMQDRINRDRRIRKIRRGWYNFTEWTAENVALLGFGVMSLGTGIASVYFFNEILGWFR